MRSYLRSASVVGALALTTVALAPALAAAPLAQSGANAITVSVAGNGNGSGDVRATNDGSGEQKSGDATPPVSVLSGAQTLVRTGVLAQEATAPAANGTGNSAACAGLAGAGGSVAKIGETNCLSDGDGAVNLGLGSLDLSDTDLFDPESALGAIDSDPVFDQVLVPVTDALTSALTDANADLADLGLTVNADAISSHCRATTGSADGDSNFAGVNITLNVPGQPPVVLLGLDTHYPPNTDLLVNLDTAVDVILQAVEDDLRDNLNGAFAPVADDLVAPAREAIVNQVLGQVSDQLGPLTDVLRLTLNRQIRTGDDAIKVRALDLAVLEAAQSQLGAPVLGLQIGNTACGPSGRISAAVAGPVVAEPAAIPTGVSAGYETMPAKDAAPGDDDTTNMIVLGAFALLVATGAGFVTYRRLRG